MAYKVNPSKSEILIDIVYATIEDLIKPFWSSQHCRDLKIKFQLTIQGERKDFPKQPREREVANYGHSSNNDD